MCDVFNEFNFKYDKKSLSDNPDKYLGKVRKIILECNEFSSSQKINLLNKMYK